MAGLQLDQVRLLPRVQFGFTPAQAALRLSDLHPLAGAGTDVMHRGIEFGDSAVVETFGDALGDRCGGRA